MQIWKDVDDFTVSNDGLLLNGNTGQAFLPRANDHGYRRVHRKGTWVAVHSLVARAFIGPQPFPSATVDHINGDRSDNRASNLRWATKSEQKLNQRRTGKFADAMPIEISNGDGVWHWFSSLSDGARAYGMDVSSASKCARGLNATCMGHFIRRVPSVVLDGERWTCIHGVDVSSFGRIKNKRSGTLWMPEPNSGAGYCHVGGPSPDRVNHAVHRLVAEAFIGPPPFPGATVDHIDRNRSNNRVENLRYATRKQQVKNRAPFKIDLANVVRKVRVTDPDGLVVVYPSGRAAAKATGVDFRLVSRVALGQQRASKGYQFEFV